MGVVGSVQVAATGTNVAIFRQTETHARVSMSCPPQTTLHLYGVLDTPVPLTGEQNFSQASTARVRSMPFFCSWGILVGTVTQKRDCCLQKPFDDHHGEGTQVQPGPR